MMEVGFEVDNTITVVGTPDFLHAFFSTIAYHLEPDGWGTRFPELMNDLYQGRLKYSDSPKVLNDLKIIRSELKKFSPDKVIWNIDDLSQSPPWGNNISDEITDLSNYFVTSGGVDLFQALRECLEDSIESQEDVTIEKVPIYGRKRVTEVGLRVGDGVYVMGTPEFLHALFSTISYHLEPQGWGTRFPKLMNHLFQGKLEHSDCREALNELNIITAELKDFGPDELLDLEKAIGSRLPQDFRRFLLEYNGGEPEQNEFDIPNEDNSGGVNEFLNIQEIEAQKRAMGCRLVDTAWPIADAECGNLVCLVLGKRQGVYFWDHEFEQDEGVPATWDNMFLLAPTFAEFWNSLRPFDPSKVELKPGQVKSVWIAPGFLEELAKKES